MVGTRNLFPNGIAMLWAQQSVLIEFYWSQVLLNHKSISRTRPCFIDKYIATISNFYFYSYRKTKTYYILLETFAM